jgi:hypothetical protein
MVLAVLRLGLVVAPLGCSSRPLRFEADEGFGPPERELVGQVRDDGASDAGPPRPGGPVHPGSCDPVSQSCNSRDRCTPNCAKLAFECARDERGTLRQAAVCSHHEECARGYACIATDAVSPRCLRYCRGDADCEPGTRCTTDAFPCSPTDPARGIRMSLCRDRRR